MRLRRSGDLPAGILGDRVGLVLGGELVQRGVEPSHRTADLSRPPESHTSWTAVEVQC